MFEFLVRDYAILIGLVCVVAAFSRLFPIAVVRIWREGSQTSMLLARGTVALFLLTAVWITVFDDWRRLLGVPTGWLQDKDSQVASDPFYVTPPSDLVRTITWVLIIGSVIGGAYLFARFSRGYIEPILLGPLALAIFFVTNTFRLRMDVESVRIAYGTIDTPIEMASTLFWIVGLLISMAALILTFYLMLWAPVALVFSLVYRRTLGREPVVEAPIFDRLRERRSSQFQKVDGKSRP